MTIGNDNQYLAPPRLVRQRQVARRLDFNDEQIARRLDFNDEQVPPPPPRLVRQHAQIMQPIDDEDVEMADVNMDIEGGSRRKKTKRRKNKTNKRRTNKRKSRGGNKKRRTTLRKSRK